MVSLGVRGPVVFDQLFDDVIETEKGLACLNP